MAKWGPLKIYQPTKIKTVKPRAEEIKNFNDVIH